MRKLIVIAAATLGLAVQGCGALASAAIDAGFRELQDDGKHARYRHQSYGRHFQDALLEQSHEDECHCGRCPRCGGRR